MHHQIACWLLMSIGVLLGLAVVADVIRQSAAGERQLSIGKSHFVLVLAAIAPGELRGLGQTGSEPAGGERGTRDPPGLQAGRAAQGGGRTPRADRAASHRKTANRAHRDAELTPTADEPLGSDRAGRYEQAIDKPSVVCYTYCALSVAPSSSGPGCMVLSHEVEGSNPFGATMCKAENLLC